MLQGQTPKPPSEPASESVGAEPLNEDSVREDGTDAAGDLVTNPDLMAEALHGAKDWPCNWCCT
jgi:hypothetical protein